MVQESITVLFQSINKMGRDIDRTTQQMHTMQNKLKAVGHTAAEVRKKTQHFQTKINDLNKSLIPLHRHYNQLAEGADNFRGVMAMTNEDFATFTQETGGAKTRMGKFAQSIRMNTVGLHGFRMELLSVMFFGMAMAGAFGSLLRPAADLYGIFDLWGTLLQVTFLPIMSQLFSIFMVFFNWVMSWDESTRMFVGAFVLLGLALGKVLYYSGMVRLGIGGLISDFAFGAKKVNNMAIAVDNLNKKNSVFSWGKLGLVSALAGGAILVWSIVEGLDALKESSKLGAEKVKNLKEQFSFLKDTMILEPLLEGLYKSNTEIKNATESSIAWGAIWNSTFAYALLGLSGFYAGARVMFNAIDTSLSSIAWLITKVGEGYSKYKSLVTFGEESEMWKKAQKSFESYSKSISNHITQNTKDILDAGGDVSKALEKAKGSFITPTEAIQAYRDEMQALQNKDTFLSDLNAISERNNKYMSTPNQNNELTFNNYITVGSSAQAFETESAFNQSLNKNLNSLEELYKTTKINVNN